LLVFLRYKGGLLGLNAPDFACVLQQGKTTVSMEVKSGARRESLPGMEGFAWLFKPEQPVEEFRGVPFSRKRPYGEARRGSIATGSVTEEQRSQTAFSSKTLRAAGLLPQDFVARRSKIAADILHPRSASCAKIPRRGTPRNSPTGCWRQLLVGGQGIPLEEFLSRPAARWF
jgi:hypothetical protein